ncbi:HORMA-1 domain-containing protein [Ensifer sesbaniae]|uniref:HORMA-1 domain-containing protein n=1 Tax=Ensifer sesbaniae TaxID=1214071 RepID=UPI00156A4537|nr:hypothetical protein [Ensifer sesbaniae]NRQ19025.1 hypothetical protein [Ensifer sesbaniae]
MSYSFSYTESSTFTVTHARHMAAKVATDLKRMQRFYSSPSDAKIAEFEAEVTEMLKAGYLETVTYGFKRDGNWIEPTLRYTARDLAGASANDDDPGRIRPGADISGSTFYSYMTYTSTWFQLAEAERSAFERGLPFSRSGAPEPGITGYLANDRTYSSGGRALDRASVRSF